MKTTRILQAVILISIIAVAASCRTSRSTSDPRYPQQDYPYPQYPDNRRYPDYPQNPDYPQYPNDRYPEYPNKNYPVYNDPNPQNLPPGQAKKIYGGKSAKPYAPGQRKKQGYQNNYGKTYKNYPDYKRNYPLIINHTRNMHVERDINGKLFYRNPDGLIYWKGFDDRYYLDERYLNYSRYTTQEYDDWLYKGDRLGKVKDIFGRKPR